jgi:hypothetical protein
MMEAKVMSSSRAFAITLAVLLFACSGCDAGEACDVPGAVELCACGSGAPGTQGARLCQDDHTWNTCDCSGAIPLPNAVMPLDPSGGRGGMAGTAGNSGAGGAGSGGTGGGTPMMDGGGNDDDGGMDLPDGGGSGGMGGSGGSGGMSGSGGMGGMDPENPYGPCMGNPDCRTSAECTITPSFPTQATVCAPKCVDTTDCPVPEGTYEAMVMCVTGYCRIDCTPVGFEALLTCPTGMTCIAPLFGTPWCHDDGM